MLLPEHERLADDPYGVRFSPASRLVHLHAVARTLFPRRVLLYMQVRTRVIDDALRAFVRGGGTQIVILGAGFDCRALRFARELADATVFEVDHPATQEKKRRVLRGCAGAKTEYVAWDFEQMPMRELGAMLASRGHDPERPTLTIWEGVTMYLTDGAIDATLRAIRGYSASGSRLTFNYTDRARIEAPSARSWLTARVVAALGEKFRFGWDPQRLGTYLEERGFLLERNATFAELARELLGERGARVSASDRLIAIARVP